MPLQVVRGGVQSQYTVEVVVAVAYDVFVTFYANKRAQSRFVWSGMWCVLPVLYALCALRALRDLCIVRCALSLRWLWCVVCCLLCIAVL